MEWSSRAVVGSEAPHHVTINPAYVTLTFINLAGLWYVSCVRAGKEHHGVIIYTRVGYLASAGGKPNGSYLGVRPHVQQVRHSKRICHSPTSSFLKKLPNEKLTQ